MYVVAHRGCADRGPENTVAAVRAAAPHVDAVEVDVRRCGTGEAVVFHDGTLDRVTDASGPVARASLATLRGLGVDGTAEPVPTLADLVAAVPAGVDVNVELKEPGLARDVAAVAREAPSDVFVSSFLPDALRAVRAAEGETLPTALLFADDWDGAVETARDAGCSLLHPQWELVDADRVAAAHDAGFGVNAWTVPDRDAVADLRRAGVDGVIVDDWAVAGRGDGQR